MGKASRKEDGQCKDQLTTRMSSFRWCRHLVRIHLFWMIFYNIWCLFAEERVLPGAVLLLTLIYCSVIGCFCWSWYWDGFANLEILRNSASSFHWLSSSIFNVRSFVVRPASVTPPLISTVFQTIQIKYFLWGYDQCHSLLSGAQFTVV